MRKIIATALVLLSCATSLTAQESQYATTFTLSERFFADTISVEWTGSQPIVPVTIEGHTYRFLLDTGSAQATVYATSAIPCKADLGGIISREPTELPTPYGLWSFPHSESGTLASVATWPRSRQRDLSESATTAS